MDEDLTPFSNNHLNAGLEDSPFEQRLELLLCLGSKDFKA
jgi:hypothetical protein